MKIHPYLILSGVIVAVLVPPFASAAPQEVPSPCSYPWVPTSTVHFNDGVPSPVDMQPTPIPELRRQLRRQVSDSLGWNDPSTCNVGVCTDSYCTVFAGDGLSDETVTGVCCRTGNICPFRSVCIPFRSHFYSTVASWRMFDGTQYCGSLYPYCYSVYWQYGYGYDTFLNLQCATISFSTTFRNPSWALYASETSPATSRMPTRIPSSMIKSNALSAGAIAGIVIGSIIAVGFAVAVIIVIWLKHRKTNSTEQVIPPSHAEQSIVELAGNTTHNQLWSSSQHPTSKGY